MSGAKREKLRIFMRGRVFETEESRSFSRLSLLFTADPDASFWFSAFRIEAQRERLANVGRDGYGFTFTSRESRDAAIRAEAARIRMCRARESWDLVPGFGAPYGFHLESDMRQPQALAAVAAAIEYQPETVGDIVAALRKSRRVDLVETWEMVPLSGDPFPADRVPHTQRGHALRWAEFSSAVLAAEAAEATRRAERAAEREAAEKEERDAC